MLLWSRQTRHEAEQSSTLGQILQPTEGGDGEPKAPPLREGTMHGWVAVEVKGQASPLLGTGFQDSSSQPGRPMWVGWWPPALTDTHGAVTDSPALSRSLSHYLTALGSQASALMHKLRSYFSPQVPILGKHLGSHPLYFISHFCLHPSFPASLSLQSKHRFT